MESKIETRRPVGRPRKALDLALAEKLARYGLTVREIADVLGVAKATVIRRCRDAMRRGRANLRMSLHRRQWRAAKYGSTQALIWLGKVYLGQSNNPQTVRRGVRVEVIEEIVDPLAPARRPARKESHETLE